MKEAGKTSERIFGYLLNLNFWIIMTIGSLISGSINGYIREGSAHEFLKEVEAIPAPYSWTFCPHEVIFVG